VRSESAEKIRSNESSVGIRSVPLGGFFTTRHHYTEWFNLVPVSGQHGSAPQEERFATLSTMRST